MTERLTRQFAFLNEADRLKAVDRANVLIDGTRAENVAEHSWHLALYALVLADFAPPGVNTDRVIAMLLLHDLVEIDTGDHPIHLDHDLPAVALAEDAAAARIFGLLPEDQASTLLALWREFETAESPDARFAKCLDHAQPILQVLRNPAPPADHLDVVRDNLATGRAARFRQEWPEFHSLASALLNGEDTSGADRNLLACLDFLAEADKLKSVLRATTLCDGSRCENSGEHSWHLALYALALADHAKQAVDAARVIRMLLLHDLVEIDVGDVPIHSANGLAHGSADTQAKELAAAERIFGLLPNALASYLKLLWQEFEAAETPDAVFAKSLDRVQPVMANLMSGGGTWVTYRVTVEQLESRVGAKVARGAPGIWHWVRAQTAIYFEGAAQLGK